MALRVTNKKFEMINFLLKPIILTPLVYCHRVIHSSIYQNGMDISQLRTRTAKRLYHSVPIALNTFESHDGQKQVSPRVANHLKQMRDILVTIIDNDPYFCDLFNLIVDEYNKSEDWRGG